MRITIHYGEFSGYYLVGTVDIEVSTSLDCYVMGFTCAPGFFQTNNAPFQVTDEVYNKIKLAIEGYFTAKMNETKQHFWNHQA